MKQKLGFAAFAVGLIVMVGVGGAVTDLPPESTAKDWLQLLGTALAAGMLTQLGVWMIKDEV